MKNPVIAIDIHLFIEDMSIGCFADHEFYLSVGSVTISLSSRCESLVLPGSYMYSMRPKIVEYTCMVFFTCSSWGSYSEIVEFLRSLL